MKYTLVVALAIVVTLLLLNLSGLLKVPPLSLSINTPPNVEKTVEVKPKTVREAFVEEPIEERTEKSTARKVIHNRDYDYVKKEFVLGDRSETIWEAQVKLNKTDCPVAQSGAGSPEQETTYLGSRTQQALRCFQRSRGLEVTGTLNRGTQEALRTTVGGTSSNRNNNANNNEIVLSSVYVEIEGRTTWEEYCKARFKGENYVSCMVTRGFMVPGEDSNPSSIPTVNTYRKQPLSLSETYKGLLSFYGKHENSGDSIDCHFIRKNLAYVKREIKDKGNPSIGNPGLLKTLSRPKEVVHSWNLNVHPKGLVGLLKEAEQTYFELGNIFAGGGFLSISPKKKHGIITCSNFDLDLVVNINIVTMLGENPEDENSEISEAFKIVIGQYEKGSITRKQKKEAYRVILDKFKSEHFAGVWGYGSGNLHSPLVIKRVETAVDIYRVENSFSIFPAMARKTKGPRYDISHMAMCSFATLGRSHHSVKTETSGECESLGINTAYVSQIFIEEALSSTSIAMNSNEEIFSDLKVLMPNEVFEACVAIKKYIKAPSKKRRKVQDEIFNSYTFDDLTSCLVTHALIWQTKGENLFFPYKVPSTVIVGGMVHMNPLTSGQDLSLVSY